MLTQVTQHVTPNCLIISFVTLLTPVTGFFSHTTHTHTCVFKLKNTYVCRI